jgi:acid stress chaperone HdeB
VINQFLRTLVFLSVIAAPVAHAQVTVDISKITCEQFIVMPKADSIAIWLSGYYHGDKHVSTLDVNQFEENARNFRAACRLPDNFKKPIMQLIESTLAK